MVFSLTWFQNNGGFCLILPHTGLWACLLVWKEHRFKVPPTQRGSGLEKTIQVRPSILMWAPAGKRSKMWIAKLVHLSEGGGGFLVVWAGKNYWQWKLKPVTCPEYSKAYLKTPQTSTDRYFAFRDCAGRHISLKKKQKSPNRPFFNKTLYRWVKT